MINENSISDDRVKAFVGRGIEWFDLMVDYKSLDEKSKARLNTLLRDYLCQPKHINDMARAIALYLRNGVLEDIHADGNLSQSNMKDINIEAANKIAGLLTLVAEDDWIRLMLFYVYHGIQISDWDMPIPYMDELDALYDFWTSKRPHGD